jgi:hypothetical protein
MGKAGRAALHRLPRLSPGCPNLRLSWIQGVTFPNSCDSPTRWRVCPLVRGTGTAASGRWCRVRTTDLSRGRPKQDASSEKWPRRARAGREWLEQLLLGFRQIGPGGLIRWPEYDDLRVMTGSDIGPRRGAQHGESWALIINAISPNPGDAEERLPHERKSVLGFWASCSAELEECAGRLAGTLHMTVSHPNAAAPTALRPDR